MVKILRRVLLIDLIWSMVRPKQDPHLRFAGFLDVFAFLWLAWSALFILKAFTSDDRPQEQWTLLLLAIFAGIAFFFFYRYTCKVLRNTKEEEIAEYRYLRYLNPVAPVVYFITVLLLVWVVINFIMLFLLAMGFVIFFLGILITFGLMLTDKTYKLDNFIAFPRAFFRAEEYFMTEVLNPQIIIAFLVLIYFVIPAGASFMILKQHFSRRS